MNLYNELEEFLHTLHDYINLNFSVVHFKDSLNDKWLEIYKDNVYDTYMYKIHGGQIVHREGGPAIITYLSNAKLKNEEWYNDEKNNRPTYIMYQYVYEELWYKNNKKHRNDGPAEIWYYTSGSIMREIWYKEDREHRDDGPSHIVYNSNGRKDREFWYNNGRKDREYWYKK